MSRAWLLGHGEAPLAAQAHERFETLLARRLAGEPLAYLRGRHGFWSLDLEVTPDVLVPRPETERLVELALERMGTHGRLADLGTGSGAIALALASERPQWQIIATDRSAAALAVAARNGSRLGLPVDWRIGTWLAPLAGERVDLIVSNPPYVAAADRDGLAPEVRNFDPPAALYAGEAGLDAYAALAPDVARLLAPGGAVVIELGAGQEAAVRGLFERAGLRHEATRADLAGIPRALRFSAFRAA